MFREYLLRWLWTLVFVWLLFLYFYLLTPLFFKKKKAPYISSFDRSLALMKELDIKPNSTLIDLWCGDEKALRFFVKQYQLKHATGYDINRFALFLGKIFNKREKIWNITLVKKNFLEADLENYDYIYVYLRAEQMEKIEHRIRETKKKETVIISNTFQFKEHIPFHIIQNKYGVDSIFLYQ